MPLLDKMGIDDPVGASATHGILLYILKITYFMVLQNSIKSTYVIYGFRSKWIMGCDCHWYFRR